MKNGDVNILQLTRAINFRQKVSPDIASQIIAISSKFFFEREGSPSISKVLEIAQQLKIPSFYLYSALSQLVCDSNATISDLDGSKNIIQFELSSFQQEKLRVKCKSQTVTEFCCHLILREIYKVEIPRWKRLLSTSLKNSCIACALVGGILLASKTQFSGNGFVFLALSSSQLFTASLIIADWSTVWYAGALFVCVDLVGVLRWVFDFQL